MLRDTTRVVPDWDYRTANTKELTHGIHPYPAMMIPQVARRLIREYGHEGGLLFDPYCGTGTTLLEALLAGSESIGTDLNPLARLIAKVKTTPIAVDRLDREIENFIAFRISASTASDIAFEPPSIPNVDYWFSPSVQRELVMIRDYIDAIHDDCIADFFRVGYSLTTRKVSWTKNSEFKLVRIPRERMADHNSDVFSTMVDQLSSNRNAVAALTHELGDAMPQCSIHQFDTVTGIPIDIIDAGSVDLIMTSPPYGDSKTTVAYGQFSRLSSQWLGYGSANRVDNVLLGGAKLAGEVSFGYKALDDVIHDIAEMDSKRSLEVASFFVDYRNSISNVASVVKRGGYACYVVGNRTVKGIEVPTAETTATFFEMNGFKLIEMFQRNIPNKRMPSMNSPTNVPGKLGKTMKSEYIIVCQKNPSR